MVLEGNTHRPYVTGMAKAANRMGWDALAWNYRSCSGEPNRYLRSYHNGVTEDLSFVIDHALNRGSLPVGLPGGVQPGGQSYPGASGGGTRCIRR